MTDDARWILENLRHRLATKGYTVEIAPEPYQKSLRDIGYGLNVDRYIVRAPWGKATEPMTISDVQNFATSIGA